MATLKVDYEYNAEDWWDAARGYCTSEPSSTFADVFCRLDVPGRDELRVSDGELEEFLAVARKLPGWYDGPAHAETPLARQ